MERHRRIRRSTLATALGAALAVSVFAPSLAVGDVVGDVLNTVGVGGGSADNRAGVPPAYQPPLHGTNPHGEGTVATVDFFPTNSNPYPGSPTGGDEEIVIGDSRGEQNGSTYHGRVTLAYVNLLPLIGPPIDVSIETNPGETKKGPTDPLNVTLADLCATSSGNVCIQVLPMDSSTSSTSSSNSFAVFTGSFLGGQIITNLGQSSGNVSQSGACQTGTGTSSIANGGVVGLGTFDVFSSSSSSTACNTGQQSTQNSSTFIDLFGFTPAIGPFLTACAALTPNSSFVAPLGVLGAVCHADDVNGGQTGSPYGVREAFTAFVGIIGNSSLVKLTLSGPESHAVAPPAGPTPATGGPAGQKKKGGPDGPGEGGAAGAVAGDAAPGEGVLAFTGANLLALLLIGAGLIGLGLLAMAARERQTV